MSGIEVNGVVKRFGEVTALADVSVSFEPGRIYGLLGRNGAGKSTLLNIITGRLFPDAGTVTLGGEQIAERDLQLGKIYYMSEKTYYPDAMRVRDILRHTAEFYPEFDAPYAADIAGQFGLDTKKKVRALSTGYRTIIKLVIALSVNTPFILLDEPVLGLDANNRDLFYKLLLKKFIDRPMCAVISTHLIDEVANIIEDVVIIKDGGIICSESRESLLGRAYTVSGPAASVDAFTAGKNTVGEDSLGAYKSAYIMGRAPETLPAGLEKSSVDLQRLFIELTNAKEAGV